MRLSTFQLSAIGLLISVTNLLAWNETVHPRAIVLSGTAVQLSWEDEGQFPPDYWRIYRDDILYATSNTRSYTDTNLSPGENHRYQIWSFSTQEASSPSRYVTITTKTPNNSFVLDGNGDFTEYVWVQPTSCECGDFPSLPVYAAIRGTKLYVATGSPGGPNHSPTDRFILISDVLDPSLTTPAPWAKAGAIAIPPGKPFIGAESTNNFVGWFNAPASSQVVRSSSSAGVIEGTIDLIETFGYIPSHLYVAAVAYYTEDGAHVVMQAPFGFHPLDDMIDIDEFEDLNTNALVDSDADGILDLTQPGKGLVMNIGVNPDHSVTLTFPIVTNRTYTLERTFNLGNQFNAITTSFEAISVVTESHTDTRVYPNVSGFYRISVKAPH